MDKPGKLTVRPVRDDDDLDALNAGSVTWFGAAPVRRLMGVPDGIPKEMWVAEADGVPVGFGQAVGHGVNDGHRGIGYVFVRPEHRRRGVGTALWQEVLRVASPDRVPGVMVSVDDDDATTTGIALAHGFVRKGLHLESVLDLSRVDGLGHLAAAPRAPDVAIRLLPERAGEEDWRGFAEVFLRLMRDAPDNADGAEDMPYETMRAILTEPWQVCGAWHRDRLVGLTCVVVRNEEAGVLNTMLTAVEREHRGLGLATALKTRHALALRDAGWSSIVTQNMEGNAAILASNRTLGFVRVLGKRDLALDY
jgi:GNAT superfamily N-acetyltransferase